jgi:hypothetical protein
MKLPSSESPTLQNSQVTKFPKLQKFPSYEIPKLQNSEVSKFRSYEIPELRKSHVTKFRSYNFPKLQNGAQRSFLPIFSATRRGLEKSGILLLQNRPERYRIYL